MSIEDINYLRNNSIKQNYTFLIDSVDRDRSRYPNPNKYTIDFTVPFKNVIGMEIIDSSIPRTMYNIDYENNELYYYIGKNMSDINIVEGVKEELNSTDLTKECSFNSGYAVIGTDNYLELTNNIHLYNIYNSGGIGGKEIGISFSFKTKVLRYNNAGYEVNKKYYIFNFGYYHLHLNTFQRDKYSGILVYIKKNIDELYDMYFTIGYEDESQEQAAIFYFSWAKMAENHTRLVTEELNENSDQIPSSEVDLISKKQAAQFQAFFSIRVAAYTESIDNLLFSMKKYLLDTCHVFYTKYVSPSLKFKSQVAAPLELDLLTTSMRTSMPTLAEEVVTAVNSFKGNFGSILTDMVQRRSNIQQKFDNLLSLNIQRKKYISYIDQLSSKASSRPKIIIKIDEDKHSFLFDQITIDDSSRMSLSSVHGNLDSLNDNDHPQYLMRSGGTIFGDIIMTEGVTIDGVDIDTHAHTGEDGSVRIKSTDIDYETPREETTLLQSADGSLLEVSINAFESSIKNGGVPTVNAVVNISIPDSYSDKYEYEIVYLEAK